MSLRDLPFNDLMAQCSRKLIKTTPLEEQVRIDEINNCNHLFVKLREYDNPEYDNSVVECVHCGVTNKYMDLEKTMERYRKSLEYYVLTTFHFTNVEYKDVTIETVMMNQIKETTPVLNMMSESVIRTYHPGVLYKIAKTINPDADNDELFEIMLRLHELETFEERKKLDSVEAASELIARYKEKVKVKKL